MIGNTIRKAIIAALTASLVLTAGLAVTDDFAFAAGTTMIEPSNTDKGDSASDTKSISGGTEVNLQIDSQANILTMVMNSTEELVEGPYANRIVTNVAPYLNIRETADNSGTIVGRMYPASEANVIEVGEEWTKISSGEVTGYIETAYVAFDKEAEALANELLADAATINYDDLNVRSGPGFEAEVVDSVDEGEEYLVVPKISEEDGSVVETPDWIRIQLSEDYYGYVYEEKTTVATRLNQALSMAEIEGGKTALIKSNNARINEETQRELDAYEAEQAALTAQAQQTAANVQQSTQNASSNTSTSETAPSQSQTQPETPETTQTEAVASTSSDEYLLACLVYCEAGAQSYEAQLAVANVVINRVKSPYFPSTIYDVIYQSGQFGPVYNGSLQKTLNNGPSSSCTQAAQAALAGQNNIDDYLFFNNVAPSNASKVYTIGAHVFYTYNY